MPRLHKRLPRFAVIMAGGHGTRFWPRARQSFPKQFLPARRASSFLQETVRRVLPMFGWERILVVTAAAHADEVAHQLPNLPTEQILIEPRGRNTTACLALANEWIDSRVGEALTVALPADHVIGDAAGLRACLREALDLATTHAALVVIGIEPSRAETGFGYIESGAPVAVDGSARWVRRFHEKPDATTARRYVRSGRHRWNAGMFIWRGSVFRAALEQCAPQFSSELGGVFRVAGKSAARIRRAYARLPALPIDVAVLQAITHHATPAAKVAVVAASFDWLDAGSWEAMTELWGQDADGNSQRGNVVNVGSRNCVVAAGKRLVVVLGADDLVVVDADDAVLVCPRSSAQAVGTIPAELARRGLRQYV